jgi:uncharacterized protein (DUF885 family)
MHSAAPHFTRWLDAMLAGYYRSQPVSATFIGIHDYDRLLPDLSEQGLGDALTGVRRLHAELDQLPAEDLTHAERIDRDLAAGMLEIQAWEYAFEHMWRGNPSLALGEAVFGVIALLLRPFAPLPQRMEATIARIEAVPSLLDHARTLIRRAPAAWIARASRECAGALALFGDGLDRFTAEHGVHEARLRPAAARAAAAIAGFQRYLASEVAEGGSYACGEEAFSLLLRRGHFLEQDADEILRYAEDQARQHQAYLDAHAAAVGGRTVAEALAQQENEHPPLDRYEARFAEVWMAARDAAIAAGLVSWPDFPIRYTQQPVWAREAAPYLYFLPYRAPAAFDSVLPVDYLVPPIDGSLPAEEQERRLRATNDSVITLNHVIHHGGLGHHVQNYYAYRAASRLGQIAAVDCASRIALFCGGSMAEGWACYATDLMDEIGFLTPGAAYAQAHTRLRMAVRAVVDVRLHRSEWSLERAAAEYRDLVGMAPGAAQAEAVKNSMFPATAIMYLAGVDAIQQLRRECAVREGAAFSLRHFHDRLLSHGSVPVARIARTMREEERDGE